MVIHLLLLMKLSACKIKWRDKLWSSMSKEHFSFFHSNTLRLSTSLSLSVDVFAYSISPILSIIYSNYRAMYTHYTYMCTFSVLTCNRRSFDTMQFILIIILIISGEVIKHTNVYQRWYLQHASHMFIFKMTTISSNTLAFTLHPHIYGAYKC